MRSLKRFAAAEDGVATTEYLMLLGILVGGTLLVVSGVGQALAAAFLSWLGIVPIPTV